MTDFVCLNVPVLMKVNFVLYRKTHTRVHARKLDKLDTLCRNLIHFSSLLEGIESKCSHFKVKNKPFRVSPPLR